MSLASLAPSPAPALRVLKFGGTSVGHHFSRVLDLIAAEHARGPVAVVISAFGDTTDELLAALDESAGGDILSARARIDRVREIAREAAAPHQPDLRELDAVVEVLQGIQLTGEASPQARDRVLAAGELLAARTVASALSASGTRAIFADARELVATDASHGAARVDVGATRDRLRTAAQGFGDAVPVIPGFVGRAPSGRVTTLGRNGSDYTAALMAAALGATEVVVWTDVSGLMTADPGLVPDAYPVTRITHREALELAHVGVRMFHPRTMLPLSEAGIPLRIRNTTEPADPGTLIDGHGAGDEARPTCVASRGALALLDVECRRIDPGLRLPERALAALSRAGLPVWLSTQSALGHSVALVVDAEAAARAVQAVEGELALEVERGEVLGVRARAPVALVSLVAEAMGRQPNVAGRFFAALGGVGINVRAISQGASERSIAAVVDEADVADAVRITHAAFNLARERVSVLLLGRGTVGGQLLRQIEAQQDHLRHEHGVELSLAGVADSQGVRFDPAGLRPGELPRELGPGSVEALLGRLSRLPVPVLVDCTAAGGMESLYEDAFRRGIHVVAANKKPLAIGSAARDRLLASARRHHRAYHYETTVGASLPVIETLKNLVRTGDPVRRIEASLSGTLGYLCGELMAGVPLSRAVRAAQEKGYTEPHPREDLGGKDAARKALILARELGLPLEIEDVDLTPFVPAEILCEDDLDAFFAALEAHDGEASRRASEARAQGKVLRYLAVIDPAATPAVRVRPVAVAPGHPAADLRGSEAVVSFTTERHREWPLTVRGAGAGGAVTASGVLADVLRIAQHLRGR